MTRSRKVLKAAILVSAAALAVMLLIGMWQGHWQKERQSVQPPDPGDAEMKLKEMEYTELQGGKRLWTLKAAEAKYFQGEQKTLLSAVKVTFFLDSGDEILLESQKGVLYAGTKSIEMWDAVQANLPRGYRLLTEQAFYDHQKQVIFSHSPIYLNGPDVEAQGENWEYRILESRAVFEGGVKGTLVFLPTKTVNAR